MTEKKTKQIKCYINEKHRNIQNKRFTFEVSVTQNELYT